MSQKIYRDNTGQYDIYFGVFGRPLFFGRSVGPSVRSENQKPPKHSKTKAPLFLPSLSSRHCFMHTIVNYLKPNIAFDCAAVKVGIKSLLQNGHTCNDFASRKAQPESGQLKIDAITTSLLLQQNEFNYSAIRKEKIGPVYHLHDSLPHIHHLKITRLGRTPRTEKSIQWFWSCHRAFQLS